MTRSGVATFMIAGVLLSFQSCAQSREAPIADSIGGTMRPVTLPDLSKMEPSVAADIRARYASLTSKPGGHSASRTELAEAYGRLGMLLTSAEYFDVAEACFQNAHALADSDVRWVYYLGHIYRFQGDLPKAAGFFEQTLQRRPRDIAALVWLGNVYLDQDRAADAETRFAQALAVNSQVAAAEYGLGRAALAREDYGSAVRHLEAALMLEPEAVAIHYPLALAYRHLGDTTHAEKHLQLRGDGRIEPPDPLMQALGGDFRSAVADASRGDEALKAQNWPTALTYFQHGVSLAPRDAALRLKLGTALFMTGDAGGGQAQFEEAIRLNPSFAKAHYSLGVLMMAGRHTDAAVNEFTAAVNAEPNYVEARLALADALRRIGKSAEAGSEYRKVIDADASAGAARFGYAMTLVQLQHYEAARDVLVDAMHALPDRQEFQLALARLLAAAPDARVRDGQRAVSMTLLLLRTNRGFDVGETMAMALAEVGRYDDAIQWEHEAIEAVKQSGQPEFLPGMQANLASYQAHQPCRIPWRDTDPSNMPPPQRLR